MKNHLYIFFCFFISAAGAQTLQLITSAQNGGANNQGTIVLSDSTGQNFHPVYSFVSATGRWPDGRLVQNGHGTVYGVTQFGGPSDSCVVYSYDVRSNNYTMLYDFFSNETLGWWDATGPVLMPNGKLYGIGEYGGKYDDGAIYSLDPATKQFKDVYDFDTVGGYRCEDGMIYSTDGNLYGMTLEGGAYQGGTIFSFNPATNVYTSLHDFIDSSGGDPAHGTLIQAPDGMLYGATVQGGNSFAGTLFRLNPATHQYTCLYKFDAFHGAAPNNPLVLAANGKLYGMCSQGSTNNVGNLFSYDLQTDSFTELHVFTGTYGGLTGWGLMQASDGKLYGTHATTGLYGKGAIFNYDITTNTYTDLFDFDSVNGSNPQSYVTELVAQNCSAAFTLVADTNAANTYFALNQATGAGTLTYLWNWGDGNTATGATPSHTYADSGYYTICVTISDSTGCTSMYCDSNAYLRNAQDLMVQVNVVTQLPVANAVADVAAGNNVYVYPNPNTSGKWQLATDKSLTGSLLEIFNAQGELIWKDKLKDAKTDVVLDAPAGIYYMRVSNSNTSLLRQLVKL